MTNPFANWGAGGTGKIGNPFASNLPLSRLLYKPPTDGYDPNAFSPKVGSWGIAPLPPRQQLANLMYPDTYYGRGGRGNAGYGGGYSTSAPQPGGFGYGGGNAGGWGRTATGNRTSATGGWGMGGRNSGWGNKSEGGMGGRGSFF